MTIIMITIYKCHGAWMEHSGPLVCFIGPEEILDHLSKESVIGIIHTYPENDMALLDKIIRNVDCLAIWSKEIPSALEAVTLGTALSQKIQIVLGGNNMDLFYAASVYKPYLQHYGKQKEFVASLEKRMNEYMLPYKDTI